MAREKKRRGRKKGSGPPGNLHPVKAGAWAVLSEVRGLRAAPRERVESIARTTAGFLSDLGAESLLLLPTAKRLLLESVAGQVEMRRAWEAYILSRDTREEFLAALEKIVGSGHYLALCNNLRASLDKLGAWERVPREVEQEGNLERLRRRFRVVDGADALPSAAPVDVEAARLRKEGGVRGTDPFQNSEGLKRLLALPHKTESAERVSSPDNSDTSKPREASGSPVSREVADGGSGDPSKIAEGKNETEEG